MSTAVAASTPELGDLPEWNLDDLYGGPEDPVLEADLKKSEETAAAFAERYKGALDGLSGDELAAAIREFEALDDVLGRIMSFAFLHYAGDQSDPARGQFLQAMQERVNGIVTTTLFFTLEINKIADDRLAEKLTSEKLAHYRPWLDDTRLYRPHQLSDDIETLLLEKSVAGRSAWNRLFDETISDLRFDFRGEELTETQILDKLSDHDATIREDAARSLGAVMRRNGRLFARITNTLAKDKAIEDKWRKYERPISARNLANRVEDGVVDALVEAVTGRYGDLSHRYYAMKAKWFGGDTLNYWDRNAPLPEEDDRVIPWAEAEKTVTDAYRAFSPALADILGDFFSKGWIDAPARPGKASGAFAHPTVPSAHPYVLLNYQGKTRDVMTLAHELGHGVHQVLAAQQGPLMADTPLTLAETASVFGEMLTFQAMLKAETDPKKKKAMLASKVEDMLNTVVRQIAFHEFEHQVHTRRQDGELTAEDLCDIWMDVQTRSLGPALKFDDDYRYFWTYIPHFIHSPFYVYAYAFGDCLVNSLYAAYKDADEGFAERYLEMLSAGGTKRHKELLAPFGLDASDPAFWHKGLDMIAGFIDELEAIDAQG
ncbi:MAG: M3 family oligoendopeptidase [Alphaproteobacteria bacterium]|nr:M3 family oligoendopeptidase [Alphaproteobacteria bacterium]